MASDFGYKVDTHIEREPNGIRIVASAKLPNDVVVVMGAPVPWKILSGEATAEERAEWIKKYVRIVQNVSKE